MTITIITLEKTASTNSYLREHRELWYENYLTVRAIEQTAGRGRFSREWQSKRGLDLTFSTIYKSESKDLRAVTLYVGYALYKVLCRQLDSRLKLKWPNDIYYNEKKLAGILCEVIELENKEQNVIIGVGLNVNSVNEESPESLNATSLKMITGREFRLDFLLNDLLKELKIILNAYKFPLEAEFLENWINVSDSIGKNVLYEDGTEKRQGEILNINQDCSLTIMDSQNSNRIRYFGEVAFQI